MAATKGSQAVRQRAGIAMGESMGVPQGTGKPRFKKGGAVDKTQIKNYGTGVRRHAPKPRKMAAPMGPPMGDAPPPPMPGGAFPGAAPAFKKGGKVKC